MDEIESLRKQIENLKNEIKQLKADRTALGIAYQKQSDFENSQIRFRTVFENSRLGNKIICSDLKILQLNQAFVKMLGYEEKEEIVGTRILDYAPEEYHAHWTLLQGKLWAKNIPSFTLETCLRRKNGETFWCQVTSILFEDQGETLGYTIIEDISVQHRAKEERENFISIASHELKTPLTSLQASFQLMNRIIEKDTLISEKLVKLSANAMLSLTKLNTLVNDLLDSTKLSKGKLKLSIARFKISDLVLNTCEHIRTDGKFKLTYRGSSSLEISADQQKLEQVLVNFINNAMKYAPGSEEIIIDAQDAADHVKVSVIDRGAGIAKNKLSLLFNSYYQAQGPVTGNSGLGLGLFISAEIIKKHDGKIGVDSEVGQGSVFWFTIPKR